MKAFSVVPVLILLLGCTPEPEPAQTYSMENLPPYSGSPYVALDGNVPDFSPEQKTGESCEFYTDLDQLGRCGACYANIGPDLMPTEERGSISSVHPSGWMQAQYDCVDGENLYNRCHLIGYQLTGENANDHNLITGTRYLNVEGMLPFENQVAEYIRETGNHVLYRATPVFEDSNLVASGVELEALSVEDDSISFHVFCYNVQPGVVINYATGESCLETESPQNSVSPEPSPDCSEEGSQEITCILNTNGKKFHLPDCPSVDAMKEENREAYTGFREDLIAQGYSPCGRCNP